MSKQCMHSFENKINIKYDFKHNIFNNFTNKTNINFEEPLIKILHY